VTTFQRTGHRERLSISLDPFHSGVPVGLDTDEAALALLRDIGSDPRARIALRQIYAEALGRATICQDDDHAVLAGLARRMVTGELKVRSVLLKTIGLSFPLEDVPEPPPPPAPAPEKPTWIEVQFLFADSGKPVKSLKIKVKPPSADASDKTTDGTGLVRVDGIKKSGDCAVTTEIKGITRANAIVVGGAPPSSPAEPKEGEEEDKTKYILVKINSYKVKTGDTLEKLAKKVGLSEKELTKFMWDTDDAKEVNKHMRWDVGCSKKSGDKFIFDDSDSPGIIQLPEPVELGASTATRTVFGVEKVLKAKPWIFSI